MPSNYQRWKNIMKAVPFEEKRLLKWQPPFIIQPKYDGIRCRAVPLEDGGYILLSSEENVIYSVPHINEAVAKTPNRFEYDGELYCHGMSFDDILSITSRTVNLHPDRGLIKFHIFDIIEPNVYQPHRLKALSNSSLRDPLIEAPFWLANDLDDVMKIFDKIIELGYEGIIIRHFNNFYERKRSTMVMKFKPKKEDEYEILGWEEEVSITGQPKGRLGSLELRSGDGNSFSVGTGFNDRDRELFWNVRETLKGKIAKVKYQHLTSGKKVPRFPVFVEIVN